MVAAAAAVLVVGGVVGAYTLRRPDTTSDEVAASHTGMAKRPAQPGVPAWAAGLAVSEARCTETDDGVSCAGSSGYRRTREEAKEEADSIAIEALVDHALARGTHAVKAQQAVYLVARNQALRMGQEERIRRARRFVADRAKVGRRDSWYWEEYPARQGPGSELRVYSRFSATDAELAALRDRHAFVSVDGGRLVPAVPGVGWVLDPGDARPWFVLGPGRLAKLGIRAGDVILLDQRRNANRIHAHVAAGHALVWRRGLEAPVLPSKLR